MIQELIGVILLKNEAHQTASPARAGEQYTTGSRRCSHPWFKVPCLPGSESRRVCIATASGRAASTGYATCTAFAVADTDRAIDHDANTE
jgi:hypothetical protein